MIKPSARRGTRTPTVLPTSTSRLRNAGGSPTYPTTKFRNSESGRMDSGFCGTFTQIASASNLPRLSSSWIIDSLGCRPISAPPSSDQRAKVVDLICKVRAATFRGSRQRLTCSETCGKVARLMARIPPAKPMLPRQRARVEARVVHAAEWYGWLRARGLCVTCAQVKSTTPQCEKCTGLEAAR
jgi:hypothetical protein